MRTMVMTVAIMVLLVLGGQGAVHGDSKAPGPHAKASTSLHCRTALKQLGVVFTRVKRKGVDDGVSLEGPIGNVFYRSYTANKPLVIDCSLAVSLALAGPYFRAEGISEVRFSSAYQRRFIRGTRRLSKHSFGLAIDLHAFSGEPQQVLTIRNDYEQGLGDYVDCVGKPLTAGGARLRRLWCNLEKSELFRFILDPDYDSHHFNHLHVEARPWGEREDLSAVAQRVAHARLLRDQSPQ